MSPSSPSSMRGLISCTDSVKTWLWAHMSVMPLACTAASISLASSIVKQSGFFDEDVLLGVCRRHRGLFVEVVRQTDVHRVYTGVLQ